MTTFRFRATVVACIAIQCLPALAHETKEKSPAPGFRPESEHAAAFCEAVENTTVAVYPTIIRTADGTTYSTSSQHRVVADLNEREITTAVADGQTIDPGELVKGPQFAMFNSDMEAIGKELKQRESETPYHLVLEILFPPSRSGSLSAFGIHIYILDQQGQNAFSFLLNSHHKLFVDADLKVDFDSDMSREMLIAKCTTVALTALRQQLHAVEHSAEE